MKTWIVKELLALGGVLGVLVGTPAVLYWYESSVVLGAYPKEVRVITLTGVSPQALYTTEEVVGNNYWRRSYQPARCVLKRGEPVILRLKSADVRHGFSIPDLEVGPVEVEPGHVTEVRFTAPQESGWYLYQCSLRCGDCHEEMLGMFLVLGPGETEANYPLPPLPKRTHCPLHDSVVS